MRERELGEIFKEIGKAALLGPITYAKELRGKQLKRSDVGYFASLASLASLEAITLWPMMERYNLTGDPIPSIGMYIGIVSMYWAAWGEIALLKKVSEQNSNS